MVVDNKRITELRHMKSVFHNLNGRLAAVVLGGAVVVAGSAFAFSQKAKTESFSAPSVDERPITRELGGHTSFAPVVKKVTPGVVKVVVMMKAHAASRQPAAPGRPRLGGYRH